MSGHTVTVTELSTVAHAVMLFTLSEDWVQFSLAWEAGKKGCHFIFLFCSSLAFGKILCMVTCDVRKSR